MNLKMRNNSMPELGVNIDHVATVRQARRTFEPDPVWAAALAQLSGADTITLHLREDRRHIQERDLRVLKETTTVRLNLELACVREMLDIACEVKPDQVTLVPEKREEVTTEGGLDIVQHHVTAAAAIDELNSAGILVSLFLDPDPRQLERAGTLSAAAVELHTGAYASVRGQDQQRELERLVAAAAQVRQLGLQLHAGHGLNYQNVSPIARIEQMYELNIGHSIIARAIMVGMQQAVQEMKRIITSSV